MSMIGKKNDNKDLEKKVITGVGLIRKFLEGLDSGQVWSDKWEVALWRKACKLI